MTDDIDNDGEKPDEKPRTKYGTKPKSSRKSVRKASNADKPVDDLPPTPKRSRTTNEFRSERAQHAALTVLQDPKSKQWKKLTRERRSRNEPMIADIDELERAFEDYVVCCAGRPHIHKQPAKDGGEFCTKSELPLTQAGLCSFIGISIRTWRNWSSFSHGSYRGEDFAEAMDVIETAMWAANIEKGLTTELHPHLMGRFLGIAERKDVTTKHSIDDKHRKNLMERSIERARTMLAPPQQPTTVEGKVIEGETVNAEKE